MGRARLCACIRIPNGCTIRTQFTPRERTIHHSRPMLGAYLSSPTGVCASTADGILICMQCAAAHRALGTHISKVRSTQLDEFSSDEFEWVSSLGNAKSNGLWEAALPLGMRRPARDSPDCIRRIWCTFRGQRSRALLPGPRQQSTAPSQPLSLPLSPSLSLPLSPSLSLSLPLPLPLH